MKNNIPVVGMKYIDGNFAMNKNIFVGLEVKLIAEKNNKYDKNAVMACYLDEYGKYIKFGYVARNTRIDLKLDYKIDSIGNKCIFLNAFVKKILNIQK